MADVTKQASTRFSVVKRSKGQSAVEKASCISRSVLVSEYDGQTYRPKYHEDLVHSEISLPPNAPEEFADRAIHDSENDKGERIPLIDKKTGQQKVDKQNRKQWKCRTVESTDWNSRENAKMWRKDLDDTINATNEKSGLAVYWEHRSFKEQGEKITPKQWKAEIQSLQTEYDRIGREQAVTATELAYAEVISYNKKNLDRELQSESRQHSKAVSNRKNDVELQ